MKTSRRTSYYSSVDVDGVGAGASTVTYFEANDQSTPKIIQIPIQSPPENNELRNPSAPIGKAAVKIQSAYRSHVVRNLVKKISAVNSEANYLQRLIQRQVLTD